MTVRAKPTTSNPNAHNALFFGRLGILSPWSPNCGLGATIGRKAKNRGRKYATPWLCRQTQF